MAEPRVSVGMPLFNGEKWLAEAIESILAQSFQDFELIISDNMSEDGSEDICRRYAARDSRIRYHRNVRNVGAIANYNLVVQRARAPYFKWASCNDLCAPRLLEACLSVLDAQPDVVLAYARTRLIFGDSNYQDYDDQMNLPQMSACQRMQALLTGMRLNNAMNGVIRTTTLRAARPLQTYNGSDLALMLELALHGKYVEVPEWLFFRRMERQASTKFKTEAELVEFYDPQKRRELRFQTWRLLGGYWRAALRAPLAPRERLCVLAHLGRQGLWQRRSLLSDLYRGVRMSLARRSTVEPST